ncbi:TetR/AcrR family transcriptional regulator [Actinomadura sp. DC4]|uniref:TetR/AcrR family transcriptional regulator n=1 Tax=Actinomadura sp. DC4 TaxID=3055069 RepID=UPI0025AF4D09|nr:TetR/AcrR family transcriptional regulator [Actinomadura sp. DC4]MDN3358289.1 TetR/AcrR family transcriptional regulator [Actinomadura sp. DC4]
MARHKEFDPDTALDRAMLVFWEQGFEKASMQELVDRMGVHKRSMYDTFGDKRSLFLKTLDRYISTSEARQRSIADDATEVVPAVRSMFETVLRDGGGPLGCFAVNSATESVGQAADVAIRLDRHFGFLRGLLLELVRRGQRSGEVTAAHSAEQLAAVLDGAWIGLRVQARAGVPRRHLLEMIDAMIAMLA